MKDMVARQKEFKPDQKPDIYFSFGYLQGRAMEAVLEQAVKSGDLSRQGILKASEEVGTVSFDGLSGDYEYGPAAERNPPRITTIYSVDPKKPGGLSTLAYETQSEPAREFQFEKADF